MDNGWIKLHRKIWKNPIVTKDPDHLAVWIYLLTHATHENIDVVFNSKRKTLKPGQLITGRKVIANTTGVNEYKVYRILKTLKNEQQITQATDRQKSLITILNWNRYQIVAQGNAQRLHNDCTTIAHKQEGKEQKEIKEVVVAPGPVSNRLTDKEWDALDKTYFDLMELIDTVDDITVDKEIKKPYSYIRGYATRVNWPRKG